MRLVDLRPKWILPPQWSEQADPFYIGVSFNCRCERCNRRAGQPRRIAFNFWPPIDAAGVALRMDWNLDQLKQGWCPRAHQRVSGESFDTLTITPSIGLDPHWHGHITNGEVTP